MSLGSLASFAENFAGAVQATRDRKERDAASARQDRMLGIMEKQANAPLPAMGAMPGLGASGMGGEVAGGFGQAGGSAPSKGDNSLRGLLRKYEGAGDYDTLYGHAQNAGGRFAGTKVSGMTLDQLDAFDKGGYGDWVAANNDGVTATPAGFGQIVGTTRRAAAKQMGLSGDTVFSPEVQNAMVDHLAWNRIRSTSDPAGRRAALRQEWVGFKKASDADLDFAINGIVAARQPVLGATR